MGCSPVESDSPAPSKRTIRHTRSVILESDFTADVDDVGALAMLHALVDQGDVQILAVMLNAGRQTARGEQTWAPAAVDAINTYYGRGDIPIGVYTGPWSCRCDSKYTEPLARSKTWPNDVGDMTSALRAGRIRTGDRLYEDVLSRVSDKSVTVVSVGYLTNLYSYLKTADGPGLFAKKVARVVIMGGDWLPDERVGHDAHNLGYNGVSTPYSRFVMETLHRAGVVVHYSGQQIGGPIMTGARLRGTPGPVAAAYKWFNGGKDRSSWDQTAVLAGVLGHEDYWRLSPAGFGTMHEVPVSASHPNGWGVKWNQGAGCHHYYEWHKSLRTRDQIAGMISELMERSPASQQRDTITFHDGQTGGLVRMRNHSGSRQPRVVDGRLELRANNDRFALVRARFTDSTHVVRVAPGQPPRSAPMFMLRTGQLTNEIDSHVSDPNQINVGAERREDGLHVFVESRGKRYTRQLAGHDFETAYTLRINLEGDRLHVYLGGREVTPVDAPRSYPDPHGGGYTQIAVRQAGELGTVGIEYLLLRPARDKPDVSVDSNGTIWFSILQDGDFWRDFTRSGSKMLYVLQKPDRIGAKWFEMDWESWSRVLSALQADHIVEALDPSSHMIFGVKNQAEAGDQVKFGYDGLEDHARVR